jgi:hypothetical protein
LSPLATAEFALTEFLVPIRRFIPGFLLSFVTAFAATAQQPPPHPSFEVLTHRMDVDVDGAPNAYGPPGKPALDTPLDAHYLNRRDLPIVG